MHDGCYDGCAACQHEAPGLLARVLGQRPVCGATPTPAALEKHAARFGPEGVAETALEFGLDVDVSAATPVRRKRRRQ